MKDTILVVINNNVNLTFLFIAKSFLETPTEQMVLPIYIS